MKNCGRACTAFSRLRGAFSSFRPPPLLPKAAAGPVPCQRKSPAKRRGYHHGRYGIRPSFGLCGRRIQRSGLDAAHGAGARGGTVIKGRQRSDERTRQRFGISLQEEQDFVMIVVPREEKTAVMTAINTACGLGAPAHGVVVAMPVEEPWDWNKKEAYWLVHQYASFFLFILPAPGQREAPRH